MREDKQMNHRSLHSNIMVRASRRAGSKVRRRWLLVLLAPGLILMTSPVSLAEPVVRNAQGFRVCEGFSELTKDDPEFRKIIAIEGKKRTRDQKDYFICFMRHYKRDSTYD
jgi:hypothetical protein